MIIFQGPTPNYQMALKACSMRKKEEGVFISVRLVKSAVLVLNQSGLSLLNLLELSQIVCTSGSVQCKQWKSVRFPCALNQWKTAKHSKCLWWPGWFIRFRGRLFIHTIPIAQDRSLLYILSPWWRVPGISYLSFFGQCFIFYPAWWTGRCSAVYIKQDYSSHPKATTISSHGRHRYAREFHPLLTSYGF